MLHGGVSGEKCRRGIHAVRLKNHSRSSHDPTLPADAATLYNLMLSPVPVPGTRSELREQRYAPMD